MLLFEKMRLIRYNLRKKSHFSGTIIKILKLKPKKPNSALRKICNIKHINKIKLRAHLPGTDNNAKEYNKILVKNNRVRDIPGIRYKIILRNNLVSFRISSRSKYGIKNLNPKVRIFNKCCILCS